MEQSVLRTWVWWSWQRRVAIIVTKFPVDDFCKLVRLTNAKDTGIFRCDLLSIKSVIPYIFVACQIHCHSGVAYGHREKPVAIASRSRWRHSMCQWIRSSDINLRAISQEILQPPITDFSSEIGYLKLFSNISGDNELMSLIVFQLLQQAMDGGGGRSAGPSSAGAPARASQAREGRATDTIRYRRFHTLVWISGFALTYWRQNNMAAMSQTIFSSAFSCMKKCWFWLKFHWNLFLSKSPINNIPALDLIMAWRQPGDKSLSEPSVA